MWFASTIWKTELLWKTIYKCFLNHYGKFSLFLFNRYDFVKMSNCLRYVSEELQESVDERYRAEQKEINKSEGNM